MSVSVGIPTALRRLTGNAGEVVANGATLRELVDNLVALHPGLAERLLDESGALRRSANYYVNQESVRFLQGPETPLKDGDKVTILPATSGGGGGPTGRNPAGP